MKKFLLIILLEFLASTNQVSAASYTKGYMVRNAIPAKTYYFDKNNQPLGGLGGWSPYSLKIPDDAFPILISSCEKPNISDSKCHMYNINDPGCYVTWFGYATYWSCAVGKKSSHPPVPSPKKEVKKPSSQTPSKNQ